jgi:hypothetical protein
MAARELVVAREGLIAEREQIDMLKYRVKLT